MGIDRHRRSFFTEDSLAGMLRFEGVRELVISHPDAPGIESVRHLNRHPTYASPPKEALYPVRSAAKTENLFQRLCALKMNLREPVLFVRLK